MSSKVVRDLCDRILELPRSEIEEYARMYERRAEASKGRNNVSSQIAMTLRLFLDEGQKKVIQSTGNYIE